MDDDPEPDRPPRGYRVDCECGFESTTFQRPESARNRAKSHARYCESGMPSVTGVEYVADGGTVRCCPRCEGANIRCNAGSVAFGGEEAEARHTCRNCSHSFETPAERAAETDSGQHCRQGTAKALIDADPDDIATDGGVPLDEHGQVPDGEGQPGTSANHCHPYANDIPDAAIHLRVAADLLEGGDASGARWMAERALEVMGGNYNAQ